MRLSYFILPLFIGRDYPTFILPLSVKWVLSYFILPLFVESDFILFNPTNFCWVKLSYSILPFSSGKFILLSPTFFVGRDFVLLYPTFFVGWDYPTLSHLFHRVGLSDFILPFPSGRILSYFFRRVGLCNFILSFSVEQDYPTFILRQPFLRRMPLALRHIQVPAHRFKKGTRKTDAPRIISSFESRQGLGKFRPPV